MPAQATSVKWDRDTVREFLKEYYGLSDWEIEDVAGDLSVDTTWDRPAIYYDSEKNKLIIEFPDEYNEIPNPNASKFYPDFSEVESVEDLREWLSEEDVEKIKRACGDDLDCALDMASEIWEKWLEKEMMEEIRKYENGEKKAGVVCGVPVVKTTGVYEMRAFDESGMEYTALLPSEIYIIDLDKVPSKEKLRCVIENLHEL